jgi:hypothetical protein
MRRRAPTMLDVAAVLIMLGGALLLLVEILAGLEQLIGPTIMLALLAVLAMFTVAGWRTLRRWWTGESALVRRVFEHADDRLQAGKYEARRSARIKRRLDLLSGNWRAAVRPAYRPGDVQMTRIHRYVQLTFDGTRPAFRRWRLRQVETVTHTWSSEAHRDAPSFFDLLEHAVAQALSIEWVPGALKRDIDYPSDSVTFTRVHHVKVPDSLSAEETLNDGA